MGIQLPDESSLQRPVIRSNFDKSAAEYAAIFATIVSDSNYSEFAQRLLAPPKTSQLMAERHGMFDLPSGAMKKDQETYDMIKEKAEAAFAVDASSGNVIQMESVAG